MYSVIYRNMSPGWKRGPGKLCEVQPGLYLQLLHIFLCKGINKKTASTDFNMPFKEDGLPSLHPGKSHFTEKKRGGTS